MSLIGKMKEKWQQARLQRTIGVSRGSSADSVLERDHSRQAESPIIETTWGNVPEGARHQAALNMKANPFRKLQVEELLISKLGTEAGLAESRRRYFEAYEDDK